MVIIFSKDCMITSHLELLAKTRAKLRNLLKSLWFVDFLFWPSNYCFLFIDGLGVILLFYWRNNMFGRVKRNGFGMNFNFKFMFEIMECFGSLTLISNGWFIYVYDFQFNSISSCFIFSFFIFTLNYSLVWTLLEIP